MNKLDFNIKPGWPGSTETWEYLQNMILQAQGTSLLGGRNLILSGCIESVGNATDGIVCIDGEIFPFIGGPVQPTIIIVDAEVSREFFGGAINPYYHNRTATFGTGAGSVAWTDFKRNNPDNGVLARLDKVEKMLKPLMSYDVAGVPTYGSWLFWGRPASEIPSGWEAVPDADWKGRVPVVMDTADADFDTVGKVGGEKKHTLSIGEIPAHTHTVKPPSSEGTPGFGKSTTGNDPEENTGINAFNSGSTGGGGSHNNLQPFKVVMFIRFAG